MLSVFHGSFLCTDSKLVHVNVYINIKCIYPYSSILKKKKKKTANLTKDKLKNE